MIGLIIAALLAVLGLIPLWRTVYSRYAAASPRPSSSLRHSLDQDALLFRWDAGSEGTYPVVREDDRRAGRLQRRHLVPVPSGQHNTEPVTLQLSTALCYVRNPLQGASGTG